MASFNHLKALFDAVVQSRDEDSFQTLQLAGKSEERFAINPKVLAKLHL